MRLFLLIISLGFFHSASASGACPSLPVSKSTEFGPVNGVQLAFPALSACVEQYRFVRFGKALSRFGKSVNPDTWTTAMPPVSVAINPFGALPDQCPQVAFTSLFGAPATMSLDCLFLRIGVNKSPVPALKPVIVYFHGGNFRFGSMEIYPSTILAARTNSVVVVAQYRLGLSGSLYVKGTRVRGNQMLQDQRLALDWVQRNIHTFGGNKNLVTIMGQSAGGTSVVAHQVTKPVLTAGLFHRVVSLSPPSLIPLHTTASHISWNQIISSVSGCGFGVSKPQICFTINPVRLKKSPKKQKKNIYVRIEPTGDSKSGKNSCMHRLDEKGVAVVNEKICLDEASAYTISVYKLGSSADSSAIGGCHVPHAHASSSGHGEPGKVFVTIPVTINDCKSNSGRRKLKGKGTIDFSYEDFDQGQQDFVDCLETFNDTTYVAVTESSLATIQQIVGQKVFTGQSSFGELLTTEYIFTPTVDACGPLNQQPTDAMQDGNFDKTIPMIIGTCNDDGQNFVIPLVRNLTPQVYLGLLHTLGVSPAIYGTNPDYNCVSQPCDNQVENVLTDGVFRCPAWEHARSYSKAGVTDKAWLYKFRETPATTHWPGCGSDAEGGMIQICHACDIPYIWYYGALGPAVGGTFAARFQFDAADHAVTADIHGFLAQFIVTGNPGVSAVTNAQWNPFTNANGGDVCGKWEAPFQEVVGGETPICTPWVSNLVEDTFLLTDDFP